MGRKNFLFLVLISFASLLCLLIYYYFSFYFAFPFGQISEKNLNLLKWWYIYANGDAYDRAGIEDLITIVVEIWWRAVIELICVGFML